MKHPGSVKEERDMIMPWLYPEVAPIYFPALFNFLLATVSHNVRFVHQIEKYINNVFQSQYMHQNMFIN